MRKSRKSDTIYSKATSSTTTSGGLPNGNDSEDEIEVEVAKRNLKVSKDAWKSFQFYKQYNDWSSETEKTDYTYSRLSSYREKEIFPGFPARPNLCRSPIRSGSPSESFTLNSAEVTMQNRQNNSAYRLARNFIEEDSGDDLEINNENSLYQRIVQSFVALWTVFTSAAIFCVEKTQSFVQQFSNKLAGSFVYVWTKTATFISIISLYTLQFWHRISRANETVEDVSSADGETGNSFSILIIRRVHTITTSIKTIYRNVYSSSTISPTKYKYLWLLLLPLLFIAALTTLYYYSINPATIVLSLIIKTYYLIIEIPYYLYKCILAAPNAFYYLIFNSFPHFFMKAIPNFFTQCLPQFFYSILIFFTQSLPQLFYSALNVVTFDISYIFSILGVNYCIETGYNSLLQLFSTFSVYTHFVYLWLWDSVFYVFSSIILASTLISDNVINSGILIYEGLLSCLNFTKESDQHIEDLSNYKENIFLQEN